MATDNCSTTGHSDKNVKCWYCRELKGEEELGIPINIEKYTYPDGTYYILVTTDGYMCSMECCLAYIRENLRKNPQERIIWEISNTNLKSLYKLSFPNSGVLNYSNNWKLLKSNGGSLDVLEWTVSQHKYKEIPGYVYRKVKTTYIQTT